MEKRPSIFLSYTHKDKDFARKLAMDLQKSGAKVWIDEGELQLGDSLIERIQEGIDNVDYLAVILTPESVKSKWVRREVDIAMNHEINGKKVKVLPLLLRQCKFPLLLEGKFYADFTSDDNYCKSLTLIKKKLNLRESSTLDKNDSDVKINKTLLKTMSICKSIEDFLQEVYYESFNVYFTGINNIAFIDKKLGWESCYNHFRRGLIEFKIDLFMSAKIDLDSILNKENIS